MLTSRRCLRRHSPCPTLKHKAERQVINSTLLQFHTMFFFLIIRLLHKMFYRTLPEVRWTGWRCASVCEGKRWYRTISTWDKKDVSASSRGSGRWRGAIARLVHIDSSSGLRAVVMQVIITTRGSRNRWFGKLGTCVSLHPPYSAVGIPNTANRGSSA